METRLVVGCGSVGYDLVSALADRPGTVSVLEENERRVERLREEGVAATHVDRLDTAALSEHADGVDTVVVAGDDPRENYRRASVASEAAPDAMLFAFAGLEPDSGVLERLRDLTDTLVEPGAATADFLGRRIGDDGLQTRKLRQAFWEIEEPLAIVAHDNPDPDAIASAVALQRIAAVLGVEAEVCYYGRISHQENRAFVNLLEFDLTRLEPDADLDRFGGFALVDHSRPGVNDQLPEDTPVDIVIDHHPPRAPVDARFVDLRSNVGATSTLLVQYLDQFGITIEEDVATGLLFGIRIDTNDFSREVSTADFEAAATVVRAADMGTLDRIESPSISGDTFETIARAIGNRQRRGPVLTSCVGELNARDALAQAADRLLNLEGVQATVVYGIIDGVIYVSGRARGTDLDLGETLRSAFDQIGSAGGHADMAGAQIPAIDTALDPDSDRDASERSDDGEDAVAEVEGADADDETAVADGEDGEQGSADGTELAADLEEFVTERFFEALRERPPGERTGLLLGGPFATEDGGW
ncbi:DHH family phosphoesterase [Halorientalis regularis]|jgi:nanoRNase/pAp phosphatase (c-di-AMP/oligoRNAs hydrolase)|uniref:NanoRNase/pAp phosphatase, hydrolyzes c-di-AMP and oligoRNAs n=1 Tax=Halorientalis regularis TaxID=660518 RepID=A0A1G7F5J6_9EURY|nr:bifunctional oligoribonuclease/PAP phosphatase NrnA [Halorientalis regularis]SDE71213.1 nanoRNase/pAp phosphatase, hydrolyzes c-di-AMP and oligoRNAs [Halorientalis regularis]